MKLYIIGCSWMRGFRTSLKTISNFDVFATDPRGGRRKKTDEFSADYGAYSGNGLNHLYEILKKDIDGKDYDYVLVQLPTPVRSVIEGEKNRSRKTREYVNLYKKNGEKKEELLSYYKKIILDINSLHSKVIFFVFNVGGYPFRHPVDFGENCEKDFSIFFEKEKLKHIILSFEGQEGFALDEEKNHLEEEMDHMPNHKYAYIIHPKGRLIFDAHPNSKATDIAAKVCKEYIERDQNEKIHQ